MNNIIQQTKGFKPFLILLLCFLLIANPFILDFTGDGAVWSRSLDEVKRDLDTAHTNYMNAVKSSDPNNLGDLGNLYQNYVSAKEEYNGLKALESVDKIIDYEPQTDAIPGVTTSKLSQIFSKLKSPFEKKEGEMSIWEKSLWGLANWMVPSLAVMALSSLIMLPMAGMLVATAALYGLTAGTIKYAHEKRLNKFRDEDRNSKEIMRDSLVTGVSSAIILPFVFMGLNLGAGVIKEATTKMLLNYSLKAGSSFFAGNMLSSLAGGGIRKIYHRTVFKDHLKVENLNREMDRIIRTHKTNNTPLSDEEIQILNQLDEECTQLKSNDYVMENVKEDVKKSLVGAVLSGIGGRFFVSALSKKSTLAARVSMKIFKDTSHAGMCLNWLIGGPISFIHGATNAKIEQFKIAKDIQEISKERSKYQEGTSLYRFYNNKISTLEMQKSLISPLREGAKSAALRMTVETAMVGVAAAKRNMIELPREREQAIQNKYFESNSEGKAYLESKSGYEQSLKEKPEVRMYQKYGSWEKYKSAKNQWIEKNQSLKLDMQRKEIGAMDSLQKFKATSGYQKIVSDVDQTTALNRRIEIARYSGDNALLEAWKRQHRSDPTNLGKTDVEITRMAQKSLQNDYQTKADELSEKLNTVTSRFEKYNTIKDKATAGQSGAAKMNWRQTAIKQEGMTREDLLLLEQQVKSTSPAATKAMYMEYSINMKRAKGISPEVIRQDMNNLSSTSDKLVLGMYGNSWKNVMAGETISGWSRVRLPYNDEGKLKTGQQVMDWAKNFDQMYARTVAEQWKQSVDSSIDEILLPKQEDMLVMEDDVENLMGTFNVQNIQTFGKQ